MIKGFTAGFVFPALISPLFIAYFVYVDIDIVRHLPLLYFGAFFWGIWNLVFLRTKKYVAIGSRTTKLGLYGAFYGLISALISGFYFEFTTVLSLSDPVLFLYIIIYPVVLFFVWMTVVNSLNLLLDNY